MVKAILLVLLLQCAALFGSAAGNQLSNTDAIITGVVVNTNDTDVLLNLTIDGSLTDVDLQQIVDIGVDSNSTYSIIVQSFDFLFDLLPGLTEAEITVGVTQAMQDFKTVYNNYMISIGNPQGIEMLHIEVTDIKIYASTGTTNRRLGSSGAGSSGQGTSYCRTCKNKGYGDETNGRRLSDIMDQLKDALKDQTSDAIQGVASLATKPLGLKDAAKVDAANAGVQVAILERKRGIMKKQEEALIVLEERLEEKKDSGMASKKKIRRMLKKIEKKKKRIAKIEKQLNDANIVVAKDKKKNGRAAKRKRIRAKRRNNKNKNNDKDQQLTDSLAQAVKIVTKMNDAAIVGTDGI